MPLFDPEATEYVKVERRQRTREALVEKELLVTKPPVVRKRYEISAKEMKRLEALAKVHKANPWIARLPIDRAVSAQRAMLQVTRTLAFVELVVPKRVTDEEIGDALEIITRRLQDGHPVWQAYLKMLTTLVWIAINAVREAVSGALGKKKGG